MVEKFKNRKALRLANYDYNQPGHYFVTICVHDRRECFGKIAEGAMTSNRSGQIVNQCWDDLPNHYSNIALDAFVIMPNHVHGIVIIKDMIATNVWNGLRPFHKQHGLPEIIRAFKSFSSRRINEHLQPEIRFQWQKSYHDHIIRDEISLNQIRQYVANNPSQWALDEQNPNYKK